MSKKAKNRKLIITSDLKNLKLVREFVRERAREFGFTEIEAEKIILAVDEVCTNSIKHSYQNKPNGKIKVEIKSRGNKFIIVVSYDGLPFDPQKIKIEHPIQKYKKTGKVKKGKLGMFIIYQFMDEVIYTRKQGKNVVILTKHLRQKDEKNGSRLHT
ncbi:MAG: ATP-binding protein [Candidatus Kryptonium sp.]|nr:ATP-binding protein [Candidatus Kryptonium sp.]MDW8108834.1 ATP-binding protein [Candidatus Kryptonium sp.]